MALYPDIGVALFIVQSETGITTRDQVFLNFLKSSKGTVGGVDEYRPHFVIAVGLHTSKLDQTLLRAEDGVTFRNNDNTTNLLPVIKSQLLYQQQLDTSQGTIVPPGFSINQWLDTLCGCKGPGKSAVSSRLLGAMVA